MDTTNINFHETKFIDENGIPQTTRIPVVQDLALLKNLPQRFIQLASISKSFSHDIPAIDIAKLGGGPESGAAKVEELDKLVSAAKEWGVFFIKNHGIDSCILHDVKDVVKGFFQLSFEEKKASVGSYMSVDNMGYGRNFVKSENQPLDWIDRLTMKAAPRDATQGLHVWPQNPPNFRQVIEKYVEAARELLNGLLQALAESLSLDEHTFLQYFEEEKSEINVRVNYYPPSPRPDLTLGITPHSDASALTLLLQFDSSNGLQVFKGNEWITVKLPNEGLLVSIGDLMEIMSNGRVRSPWHRVVNQMDMDRFSVALFYNPPLEKEIEPVEENEGYKKVNVGAYLKHYYEISPTSSKEAILFAKE
ncbi:unnamed protein product [Fraxinus pennsylvanica]|uniref:Fe2OG dioxygenase domain-containing protein n=1 Tax=Fraxinus pennsylvanica TaxID=56036 RepID=A0AAD2A6I9_9LAMI|nr:unnamed protein product [Fraxinus pennsylvanica]